MNDVERQLATLLKQSPGEPPMTLDPAALMAATAPRRRYLAPVVAAAVVLAVAVPVAVLVGRGSSPKTLASSPTTGSIHDQPTDPRQAAIRAAETIIATAPAPPASRTLDPPLPTALKQPSSIPGAQHVQRTRLWTAPGTVGATISYLESHQPAGMQLDGSGTTSGPNGPTTTSLEFSTGELRSLQYAIVAYRGGVAIRADAQVLWAPFRPRADTVPASVSSVNVVIVRENPQLHQAAPTVHRTLTGAAAHDLADFVNGLPRAIPGISSCPDIGGERETDQLVFHTGDQTAKVLVNLAGCASTTFQIGHRTPIQLSQTFVGAVSDIDQTIMKAVGLPANYGR